MKLKIKISIANQDNEGFMGIGLVWLLRKIEEFKSINRAAREMGMSYAKALKILNRLEENLGRKVLIRKRGGQERGGAELTPFAEKFIEEYDRFQKKIKLFSNKEFVKFNQDIIERKK